tara:strand:+ start:1063 stop:3660 length:2598 start_codon:yes stop_codon:yes gene_type:complete
MIKVLRELFFWIFLLFIIFITFFTYIVVKSDYKLAHQSHMVWKAPHNWNAHYFVIPIKKFLIKLFGSDAKGLPAIKIYVENQSEKKLLENTPYSTKEWQSAKIIFDNDDKLKNIKFRYRGDNPENWLFEKKSIRIRLRKNEMINRQRYFEYWPVDLKISSSTNLAIMSGVDISKIRLVELYVNDVSDGIFMEFERLDENFLRRNKFMPVNLYKGENYNTETKIGLDRNLYNNEGLWKKNAVFNKKEISDKSDLKKFLISLKQSTQNIENFNKFLTYIDMETWAKYCAYLIISQNQHHSPWHNNRLIVDPWSGHVTPVVNDPEIIMVSDNKNPLILDFSTNDLTKSLNQNSLFIDTKYKWINYLIKNKNIINKEINYLDSQQNNIINSIKRDPQISYQKFAEQIESHKKNLKNINDNLIKKINSNPDVTWSKKNKKFTITVKSEIPASNIKLHFGEKAPKWIIVDENYNGLADSNEIKYYSKDNNFIKVKADFYANRLIYSLSKKFIKSNIYISPAKFDFISEDGSLPINIQVKNKFSQKVIDIKENKFEGSQTTTLNKVLHKNLLNEDTDFKILSDTINIEKDVVFNSPVKILPGTTFLMGDGANLIFKNKVLALGDNAKKIKFIRKNKNKNWGSVSLIGKLTSGSKINNVDFDGGSGGYYNQYFFTSMFSIHNSKNINIDNVSFSNNAFFDDMLHIVYSDSITLNNAKFTNAYGDAVDVDVSSNIVIKNSKFLNSENDAIDFMESSAVVNDVYIEGSKDKGVSIGESSTIDLSNNKFINNNIAVAIKDASRANIENSLFLENKNNISAYKKNWQYGSGGLVKVKKSEFTSDTNKFSSLNKSKIEIIDSKISGKKLLEGKNIYIK